MDQRAENIKKHLDGIFRETEGMVQSLVNPEVVNHLKNAGQEALAAFRAAIDQAMPRRTSAGATHESEAGGDGPGEGAGTPAGTQTRNPEDDI